LKRGVLSLLVCMVVATVPASAAPSFLGMTGLLNTPTADALDTREWNVAFHHISDNANIAAGNVALAAGLEAGVVWFDPNRGSDERFTAQAKYRLIPETPTGVGLAVGWWDVADEIDSSPYGVISKRLTNVGGFPLRGHLGLGGGIYDGIFAGVDLPLAENVLLMVEYDSEDVNAGIRLGLARGFRIDAGFVSEEFGIGGSYNTRF
jgi:hypothetical protein